MTDFVCTKTGRRFGDDQPRWRSDAGALLDLDFEAIIDDEAFAARPPGMWRYREALPLPADAPVASFNEGFTPLIETELDGRLISVKLDYLFPSGSYKDRGASLLISRLAAWGVDHVVEDSSGNAGAAIATYCALAGIACEIYVPQGTSSAKTAQLRAVGAEVVEVPGDRAATEAATLSRVEESGAFYASHVWNPHFLHGTKTFLYELREQCGWDLPDAIVLPAGHGTLLLGCALALEELRCAGRIDRLPKLFAVQSAACDPLTRAFEAHDDEPATITPQPTMAEGIAIARPHRGAQMLRAVGASGGAFLSVTDEEITSALTDVRRCGLYVEPTSAAAIAGLRRLFGQNLIGPEDSVATVLTGHGLKSPPKK